MRCLLLLNTLFVCGTHGAEPAIEFCDEGILPVETSAPQVQPRLHNEHEGYALVDVVVSKDGTVLKASIKEEKWKPLGNSKGQPVGYTEAILDAVLKYKYSQPIEKCSITTRVSFEWESKAI